MGERQYLENAESLVRNRDLDSFKRFWAEDVGNINANDIKMSEKVCQ